MKPADFYLHHFSEGLRPDPDWGLAEWSNAHRILPQKGAAEPGPYRIERTPYLREIAECLSPRSPVERIVWSKSAQVGASELGYNWLGFIIHASPGPVMMVCPTTELAEKVSKQRVAPMIEDTPALVELIGPAKSKDSGQTILLKEFPGGILSITGANSPVGLRSMPVRYLFCDEVDAYPHDVGNEGDPVSLAEKRTTTFKGKRKVFLVSTPTVKDASRIEAEFLRSDQRRYFVPCPHCDEMQWLKFRNLKWDEDRPETTNLMCEACGVLIEERYKTQMLERGEWRATAIGDGRTAGFHISALYSPVGWKSWAECVDEFLKAKGDAPLLKTWVNTTLGETWEEEFSAKMGADELLKRVEIYPAKAPAGVFVVTAGVDVQDNRLEITRWGWGRDEESWKIDHTVIYGDPSKDHIWKQLDELLEEKIPHEIAEPLSISAACIDSGGSFTAEVYQYTRLRRDRRYMAIKGQSIRGKPIIGSASRVDINYKGQSLKGGGLVFPVGSDTAKSVIYNRLKHNEPGPGYIHFPAETTGDYLKQLTSEKLVTRYVKGFPVKEWQKKSSDRNEALDCAVYALAAMRYIASQYSQKTMWDQLEKKLKIRAPIGELKTTSRQDNPIKRKINVQRSNFVSSW